MLTSHFWTLLLTTLPATAARTDTVPLYDNLGTHHFAISTKIPRAQQFFDQGLRLTYGFNHGEAIRAFNEAARLDPACAMCYWGTALAFGPHVNAGMDSASSFAAYAAVKKAAALASRATAREQAYIRALARRYSAAPPADRGRLDSAYSRAMAEVVRRYPDDLDAATLYAESLMDLRPWNYWKKNGEPYPGTRTLLVQLERVLKKNPDHPGACHYFIHAVEAVAPERAVSCAERLAGLMPGVGHMVHMPGHIYIRIGRYEDAIASNVHAVHTDESYIASESPSGVYPIAYYPHNYHFLSFAATMVGKSKQAIDAARSLVQKVPPEVARQVPPVEPLVPFLHLTLATFGKWDDVLGAPVPPADLRYATGMVQYARGSAFAAKQQWPDAQKALDTLTAVWKSTTAASDNKTVLGIAMHALIAEIAARQGKLDDAAMHYRVAMKLEDGLPYIEPPLWHYPIRHSLGKSLLEAGKAAEAEKLYREDLKRFPGNGWSLHGLAASLRARGANVDAERVERDLRKAWAGADVVLTASRF
ncbi:MAG: hypothetical protein H0W30_05675 [Gemmatimonadaceae bacterium]|nr:hypothetical protein [Gemmatimonadaceae bacterium]